MTKCYKLTGIGLMDVGVSVQQQPVNVNQCVPHGSWLRTLFIVYLSDMNLNSHVLTHKYIDDTTLSEAVHIAEESRPQAAVTANESWSQEYHMRSKLKKTKEMVIHLKTTPLDIPWISLNSADVERTTVFKLLGV